MKKFLAVFVAPIEAYDKMKEEMKNQSPEEGQNKMQEWKDWMDRHKDSIVDPGAPVGSAKRITEGGTVEDVRNTIGGYMIVQAESADEAAKMYEDSPHFGVSEGAVEIMEMMQM